MGSLLSKRRRLTVVHPEASVFERDVVLAVALVHDVHNVERGGKDGFAVVDGVARALHRDKRVTHDRRV